MNGRDYREKRFLEGTIEFADCVDSVRYPGRKVTRFLIKDDERCYLFYSETPELSAGRVVRFSLDSFSKVSGVADTIELLDKNHKLEVLK